MHCILLQNSNQLVVSTLAAKSCIWVLKICTDSCHRNDHFSGVLICNGLWAVKFQCIFSIFNSLPNLWLRKCSDFSMKHIWKNIVFTEIFKYFIMPSISLRSVCVFTLWYKTTFLGIAPDSEWNSLSHRCFCTFSLFSYECTYSDLRNTYKQATKTLLIPITSIANRVLNRQMYWKRGFSWCSFILENPLDFPSKNYLLLRS